MAEQTHDAEANPLQGYFDWQITTLMLAYDLSDPIPATDKDQAHERREKVTEEVRALSLAQVPKEYLDNTELDWPAHIMQRITRSTLQRVGEIIAPPEVPA